MSFPPISFIDASSNLIYNNLVLNQQIPLQVSFTNHRQVYFSYYIQKPYDKKITERYSQRDNIHNLIIFSTDKPHLVLSNTEPRTEIRFETIKNYNTTYRLECKFYSPRGCYNHSLFQILSDIEPVLQLRILDGHCKIPGENKYTPILKYDDWNNLVFILILEENIYSYVVVINDLLHSKYEMPINNKSLYLKLGVYNLKGYPVPEKNEIFLKDIAIYEYL
jgi:hypothetical protein